MKILKYLIGTVFKHVFALLITFLIFAMLAFGDLSETGQTRMEDLMAMIVGYYFLASMNSSKKTDASLEAFDAQSANSSQTETINSVESDTLKSGDKVIVTKE